MATKSATSKSPAKKKKPMPPWLAEKTGATAKGSGTGSAPSAGKNTANPGTPPDNRKAGRGKTPGPTPGTAAARAGSAAGGKKSKRGGAKKK